MVDRVEHEFDPVRNAELLEKAGIWSAVLCVLVAVPAIWISASPAVEAGVCVLASDTPENREVIGDVGFAFRRGDAAHLRQMITMLLPDADSRSATARRAQRRIQQEHLWDAVTQQLEQMYLGLTSPKSTPLPAIARAGAGGRAA